MILPLAEVQRDLCEGGSVHFTREARAVSVVAPDFNLVCEGVADSCTEPEFTGNAMIGADAEPIGIQLNSAGQSCCVVDVPISAARRTINA